MRACIMSCRWTQAFERLYCLIAVGCLKAPAMMYWLWQMPSRLVMGTHIQFERAWDHHGSM